jgi:probable phosphoglycerate mutase
MSSVPTIVFLRHGETDWNVEGRLQGQRDIPLNANGRGQARRNGEIIAREIPEAAGFDFVASPLWRARETMEIARAAMNLDPKAYAVDPRLVEITFGELEGFTYRDIEERQPCRRQRSTGCLTWTLTPSKYFF